jgi:hypothetical protein
MKALLSVFGILRNIPNSERIKDATKRAKEAKNIKTLLEARLGLHDRPDIAIQRGISFNSWPYTKKYIGNVNRSTKTCIFGLILTMQAVACTYLA